MTDPRQVLINIATGFYLADHMGDVSEDIWFAIKEIGIVIPDHVHDNRSLAEFLAKEHGGTTVYGTSVLDE